MAEDHEVVPGMAEKVEARRRAMRLGPKAFATAAGATLAGVSPIRNGRKKQYQDRILLGVAQALEWPDDWYAMLQRGEDPDRVGRPSALAPLEPGQIVEAAINADTRLHQDRRAHLITLYRAELARAGGES